MGAEGLDKGIGFMPMEVKLGSFRWMEVVDAEDRCRDSKF